MVGDFQVRTEPSAASKEMASTNVPPMSMATRRLDRGMALLALPPGHRGAASPSSRISDPAAMTKDTLRMALTDRVGSAPTAMRSAR